MVPDQIKHIESGYKEKLKDKKNVKLRMLFLEFVLTFFFLPAFIYLKLLPLPKFSVLLVLSFFAFIILLGKGNAFTIRLFTFQLSRPVFKRLIIRFLLFIPSVIILTIILSPLHFFRFPIEQPFKWAITALLYPLFSALPQEILYRVFFFDRYQPIFGKKSTLFFANAAAFSFLHIIYNNPVAPVLTFAGGYLFSNTYKSTDSLPVTTLEHSVYGYFIFTVGLGQMFFT